MLNVFIPHISEEIWQILGNNKGIEIVGDRFVFPSEILFDLGSDELEKKGLFELSQMAKVIRKIVKDSAMKDRFINL